MFCFCFSLLCRTSSGEKTHLKKGNQFIASFLSANEQSQANMKIVIVMQVEKNEIYSIDV